MWGVWKTFGFNLSRLHVHDTRNPFYILDSGARWLCATHSLIDLRGGAVRIDRNMALLLITRPVKCHLDSYLVFGLLYAYNFAFIIGPVSS